MAIAVRTREGVGRCAVTPVGVACGTILLEEKAALFWQQGPQELLDIIHAYQAAGEEERSRIDNLTAEVQTQSAELDRLISTWTTLLQEAIADGKLNKASIHEDLLPILLKAHFNAHAVQSPDGACLFPQGAMLNHSCAPNTFYRCEAHTIRFVAIDELHEGTELTASYLDAVTMIKPTKYRQKSLLLSKGFICSCERCATANFESTRRIRCKVEHCQGLLYSNNSQWLPSETPQASIWSCQECKTVLVEQEAEELEARENELYKRWEDLDFKLCNNLHASVSDINEAIEASSRSLHPQHFITQLLRVLYIEIGVEGGIDRLQVLANSYIYADWLFDTFRSVPANLLGTMTGALANLFDRKTSEIVAGLSIDRVLAIIKGVLPYARLRYGTDAAYPTALAAVIERYTACSSLICSNKGKLMRCGRCDSVAYCSRSCQVFHFKSQGHKAACGVIVETRKRLTEFGA